jgi:hypothetical protein
MQTAVLDPTTPLDGGRLRVSNRPATRVVQSRLPINIHTQPDDSSCGPTCLHAVYRYHGDDISLSTVLHETERLDEGGTLAVLLGCHALDRGYRATLYSYNLHILDPSWFQAGVSLIDKLRQQSHAKPRRKLQAATRAYMRFLDNGGIIRFEDLTAALVARHLRRSVPILTGLSATYLYRSRREVAVGERLEYDDIHGEPQGHFVVLCGYDSAERLVLVADPWGPTLPPRARKYWVDIDTLVNSILLGVLTYDANLLLIEPRRE